MEIRLLIYVKMEWVEDLGIAMNAMLYRHNYKMQASGLHKSALLDKDMLLVNFTVVSMKF
jgi:hypothetical protein